MSDTAPIAFTYLAQLYERLDSKKNEHGFFEGSMTKEFKALGISQSYYSKLYAYLYEMNCIEILRRGSSGTHSLLKLNHAPELDAFRSTYLTNVKPRATLLEQRINRIERRLPNIDVEQALASLAHRMDSLEAEINRLTNAGHFDKIEE